MWLFQDPIKQIGCFPYIAAPINQIDDLILLSTHVKVLVSFHNFLTTRTFSRATSWASCSVFRAKSRTHHCIPPLIMYSWGRFKLRGSRIINLTAQYQIVRVYWQLSAWRPLGDLSAYPLFWLSYPKNNALRLYRSTWPLPEGFIQGGTCLVDLQKLTNILKQFTLEVLPLISKDLKRIPKPNEKRIDCNARCQFCGLGEEGHTLNPFCETVHHQEYVLMSIAREGVT